MAQISWGKPRIFIGPKGALSTTAKQYEELSTPIEGSTTLTANQGDKKEALIEGGESECTKFNAATFELTMQVRMAKDRTLPSALRKAANSQEFTSGEVGIILQPEDAEAPGFLVEAASVSVIESFNSDEGAVWEFTFAPVVNDSHEAVQWKTVTLPTVSNGKYPFTSTNLADFNRFATS